jgi:hypothetical protein
VQVSLTRLYLTWGRPRAPEARQAYVRRILVNSLIDERRRPSSSASCASSAHRGRWCRGVVASAAL